MGHLLLEHLKGWPLEGADHPEAYIERDLKIFIQSFWQILVIIESGNHRSILVNLETELK